MSSGPWAGRWHYGRSWISHELEDRCPCPQAACGLVEDSDPECPEHGPTAFRTMRQSHPASACPGRHDLVQAEHGDRVHGSCTCGEQYGSTTRAGLRSIIDEHLEHRSRTRDAAIAAAELAADARRLSELGE